MDLPWVVIGVCLVGIAVYTVRDPTNRGRSWARPADWKRDPGKAEERHRTRTVVWAIVTTLIGLAFVVFGLAR